MDQLQRLLTGAPFSHVELAIRGEAQLDLKPLDAAALLEDQEGLEGSVWRWEPRNA